MEIKEYQNEIYVVDPDGNIETMTYQYFLEDYCQDETTSPRGVENRRQVCSIIEDENGNVFQMSINNRAGLQAGEGELLKWGIWDWGVGGNHGHLLNDRFDTEEEAYSEILRGFEYDLCNKSFNHPAYFDTQEEAEQYIAECFGIDIEVYKSIEAKRKRVEEARKAKRVETEAKARAERQAQFEQYKNLIKWIEGESYKETAARLSDALDRKIKGSVFHQIVKFIRM